MPEEPRRFHLVRDTDETGVSGVGVVVEGVEFTDGTVALRWLSEHTSTAVYRSIDDVEKIHGHAGKTRIEWLDIPMPPPPDYASVWLELRGYVMEAVADGGTINPAGMLRCLDELQRKAHGIGREWLKSVLAGEDGESGESR